MKVLVRTEEVGGFSVSVPGMPGCHSEGETLPEALANIREAAELWLEVTAENAESDAKAQSIDAELAEIEGNPKTVVVPVHGNKDLKPGTQHGIMRDAGLTEQDL
ncbi:MAG TPA: type II toxin-antitoxin system HicB family antitoxin [Pirellulales bacterium]|nr:type II toxin-antitoxin system HicB family antitoxin [Pirellulales bacterium]